MGLCEGEDLMGCEDSGSYPGSLYYTNQLWLGRQTAVNQREKVSRAKSRRLGRIYILAVLRSALRGLEGDE